MRINRKLLLLIGILIIIVSFNLFALFHSYRFTHPVKERVYEYKGYKGLQKIEVTVFGIPPLRSNINHTPSNFGLTYYNVSLATSDNIRLHAWLIPSNNTRDIILLAHGYGGNKASLLKYAAFLNKNNYSLLLLDLRAHGLSEGSFTSLGYYEEKDIESAIIFLKSQNFQNIGAFGYSMGGASLLSYLTQNKGIDAIVIVGVYNNLYDAVARRVNLAYHLPKFPFATALVFYGGILLDFNAFELSPEKFVSNVNIPILVISNEDYNLIISSEITAPKLIDKEDYTHKMEDALKICKNANNPKEIFIVEKSTSSKEYEGRIIEFFDEYLKNKLKE